MNISSIGVQQILPQSGIGNQSNPAPDQKDDDADIPVAKPDRAPAAPGTGQTVDKLA